METWRPVASAVSKEKYIFFNKRVKTGCFKNLTEEFVLSIYVCAWVGVLKKSYLNTATADGEEMKAHTRQKPDRLKIIVLLLRVMQWTMIHTVRWSERRHIIATDDW